MRTLVLISVFAVAGFCTPTKPACPEGAAPVSQDKNVMDLGCGQLDAIQGGPGAILIEVAMPTAEQNLVLNRSFVDAIQGNLDRETVEYRNAEVK